MSKMYLKSIAWDFVLVAVASVALCYTLLNGFNVDPALQYGPIPGIVSAVCLLALFFVGSSKGTVLVGGVVYGIVVVVSWLAGAALSPADALTVDVETNYLIFAMVLTATPTACYLLSRNRAACAVLFVASAFLIGLIQLFYGRFEIVWTVLLVVSTLALMVYKNYQLALKEAMSVEKVAFLPGFAVAAGSALLAVGLGALIWVAIIAPLNPGALEIKLITEYRSLETVQVRGTSADYQIPNLDMTSDETNSDFRTTDDAKEDAAGERIAANGAASSNPDNGQSDGAFMGLDLDALQDSFDMQSNPQNWPLLLILILPLLLIVGYFVLRRSWRVRRLNVMRTLGPDGEFEQLYLFLMSRFERIGVKVPDGQTMSEFAVSSKAAMYHFEEVSGVEFKGLADSYSTLVYGIRPVTEGDVADLEAFYLGFWKGARRQLGNLRYFFSSLRL